MENITLRSLKEETIHIALGMDKNYAKYAGVCIQSIIFHHIGQRLSFHIFFDEINDDDRLRLDLMEKLYRNVRLYCYQIPKHHDFSCCPTSGHITRAAYFRLLMPNYLPDSVKKILYLDSDVLCVGSLQNLWQMKLDDDLIGAVPDATVEPSGKNLTYGSYFNSGVLLINMEQWRKENFTEKLIRCCIDANILDQDALNKLTDGRYLRLPPIYNHMLFDGKMAQKLIHSGYLPADFQNRPTADTCLIHYATSSKPWHKFYTDEPHKKIYWEYVKRSLWYDLAETEPYNEITLLLMIEVLKEKEDWQSALAYAQILMEHLRKQKSR